MKKNVCYGNFEEFKKRGLKELEGFRPFWKGNVAPLGGFTNHGY